MTIAQQRGYAEALLEENQALKKRVAALQQNDSAIKSEVQRLRQQLDSSQAPAPTPKQKPTPTPEPVEGFSGVMPSRSDEFSFTDPSEIMLFPQSDADNPAFLISQMRLNDEFSEELDALERRRREVVSDVSRLSRQNLLTKNTP